MGIDYRKGVVLQMWRSFIIFILIPVAVLNIAIFYMLHDMENTAKDMAKTQIGHARFLLDQNINDSLASIERIGSNFNIQRMASLERPLDSEDYAKLWEIQKFCQNMVTANDAYSVNILCNGSNIFMTEGTLCMDLEEFYGKSYRFGETGLEELKEVGQKGNRITYYPYSEFVKGTEARKGFFYTRVMTPFAGTDTGATAIVFLNEENLLGILGKYEKWDNLTYIMDAQGKILYRLGNQDMEPIPLSLDMGQDAIQVLPDTYFGKDCFAVAAEVTTGLKIVSVIPKDKLYMEMGRLRIFIWILNATTIIMCLSLSLSLARKRSRILSGALELMNHKEDRGKNVFSALYDSVSTMVDANVSLKSALGVQKELLQSVFWSRMLTLNTMSDEEIDRLAQSAGIEPLKEGGYCLLLMGFGNGYGMDGEALQQQVERRKQALEIINRGSFSGSYAGMSGADQLVILVCLDEEECPDYQNLAAGKVHGLSQLLEEDSHLICVGSMVFTRLRDIYSAYVMCGNRLNLWGGYGDVRGVSWCSQEELGTESTFYYTDELKNQIVLWIKSGQQELVKEGFHRILEENYIKRRVSHGMEQLLIAKLKLTLLGAYDSRMTIDLQETFKHIDEIQTDAWLFSYVLRVAMDMCGHYLSGIKRHEDGLSKTITTYVEEHFTEYGFELAAIAEHCKLSETYFSQIFKELMGENFSVYVEKKRMDYAYRLIVETDMTIDLVAEKTGYSNTNAFRKAYKRFYGMSPSQSRKNKA
jgi:two-component system response regulator YesN